MASEAPATSGQHFHDDSANVFSSESSDRSYPDKHVYNISVRTGEEFSPEFLRDRVSSRAQIMSDRDQRQPKRVVFNFDPNHQLVYEDLANILGLRRDSDCGSDISGFNPRIGYSSEIDKAYSDQLSRFQMSYGLGRQGSGNFLDENYRDRVAPGPTATPLHASDSPQSYQCCGSGISDGSSSGKMKFLCSFGGKILPRPHDGKLRYVGGETRIISIRKNLAYDELVKKTSGIWNQPHTIKYQLPGEDLDSLISVSCDEDLHHLIEEYHELERIVGSQRLRIFLVSSSESESPSSIETRVAPQNDADYHYVVAVNGMLDPSPRKSSSGHSLASQASHFGNMLENSPSFRKDSPTSAHPLEMKVGASSSNLATTFPNPSAQYLTVTPTPMKPFILSPPVSPLLVQHRDPKNSPRQFYEDHSCHDVHESIGPFFNNKLYDNSSCIDSSRFYHNHPCDSVALMDYHHRNSHLAEIDQINKFIDMNFYNCYANGDYVPPPHVQIDMDFERKIPNERAFHSGKNFTNPEDQISNDSVGPHPRMSHALSDSKLQEREEKPNAFVEEGIVALSLLNFETEKSPSSTTSGFMQECQIQLPEKTDGECRAAKYENLPPFKPQDQSKFGLDQKVIKLMDEKDDAHLDQIRKTNEGNINISSQASAMDYKNVPNIIPSVHISPQELQVPEGVVSTSPVIVVGNSGYVRREYDQDCQLHTTASDFSTQSQKASKDQQHTAMGAKSAIVVSLDSHGTVPVASLHMGNQEGTYSTSGGLPYGIDLGPNLNLHKNDSEDAALGSEACFCYENHVINPSHKVDKVDPTSFTHSQASGNCCEKSEPMVIVEDVTDSVPSGIPSSSTVVPHVQDNASDGFPTPRETEAESIAPESSCEYAKADGRDDDESISEATMAEIEAGVYGLQIIKNADLEELKELGSGTFGTVYHGKWRGTDVAIKRIKKSCFAGKPSEQERLTKDFWREAQILSNLHHPNVVAFYGVVPDGPGGTLATVTEFMVNGSLRHVLLKKDRGLDRRKRLIIAMDAAFGMEYLHMKNIVHFDLKCDNLLVNLRDPQRPICKVGDFGLSRIKRNTLVSGGVRGTLPWMAPELLNGNSNRVSEKVDVFSFGVAMWEILTGEEPYGNMHCGAIIGGIVSNTLRPPIPERCDPEWRKLMEECWSPDPAARPSFTEITNRLRIMSMTIQTKRYSRVIR
ncbi:uncharacterized protein LOC131152173 [Malania oleifera]|uniref:uncharacterized protein LOC131152173 n=1 Tax=Malania oleifera TaxID=397392 RepID=UPI0025ADE282|nr:uncharacterized protein LOC131152173 [Malania oleifera]XP_057959861.1 uncharacterized protein LOC131152173 [Malania oleifera]